jgi:hypothetical protein
MTRHFRDQEVVREARAVVTWAREAQDNEYRHLLVVNQKLAEDDAPEPRYMSEPLPSLIIASYALLMWVMARVDIRRAFLLNAEFEDHAEHTYAGLVDDHPEWAVQPVSAEIAKEYGSFSSWADVFRRIGLDERDHMNTSFVFAGRPGERVVYEGMPAPPEG